MRIGAGAALAHEKEEVDDLLFFASDVCPPVTSVRLFCFRLEFVADPDGERTPAEGAHEHQGFLQSVVE